MNGIFVQPNIMNMMVAEQGASLKCSPKLKESPQASPKLVMKPLFAMNEPITKHSARLIRRQMIEAGQTTQADRCFLRELIMHGNLLDQESFYILLNLLLTGLQEK